MIKKIKRNQQLILIVLLAVLASVTTFALTYGSFKSDALVDTVEKGVLGDTVYVNDLKSDYYHYQGLNYTNSDDGNLPTLDDDDLYNYDNLVKVTITYNGHDYNNPNIIGYVSLTEQQSKYVYYKYYVVENGYIDITLIDNPFTDHPNDKVFNGWVTDYEGATVSLDKTYYERHLKVPVVLESGKPKDIKIDVFASWVEGVRTTVSGSRNYNTAFNDLKAEGMNEMNLITNVYGNPIVDGYYIQDTIETVTTATQGSRPNQTVTSTEYGTCTDCYDSSGNYYAPGTEYRCPAPTVNRPRPNNTYTNECQVYYQQDENDTYDENETYYRLQNRNFVEVELEREIIGTEINPDYGENANMSGYYRRVSISRNNSIAGYYSADGTIQSGSCTSTTCTVYELIQFYDELGNSEKIDTNETYYYLTTRDTNVIVMTANMSSTWSSSNTKPFTLTGINNGVDYGVTWNVNQLAVICYNDTRIENLTINGGTGNANTTPTNATSTARVFYANQQNAKIGRGIKRSGNNVTFITVLGARNSSASSGSAAAPIKHKLEVETGFYNSTSLTVGGTTGTSGTLIYTEMYGVYGNDYDRVTEENDELLVYYCASGGWGGRIHSSNDTAIPALNTIVKSGSFGTGKSDLTTGIYVGARYGGTHYAPRLARIEGGYIYNLNGGPITVNTKRTTNDTYIYMTGGNVDMIVGGAGTSTTYGNRIVQVTGGQVNYSVVGGSNGSDGSSTDGTITGSTYVYIGGTATIGNDQYINNGNTLWGAESGSVFGAGNGRRNYETIGSVDNSNVVIADEANVKTNVYGSGNFGTVGYNSNANQTNTNIKIVGGTVHGSVFGSGNNSGSGNDEDNILSNINVTMTGGVVLDGIYGGSNQEGLVYGSTTVNILNGSVKDVYGGGLGVDTYVARTVDVNIGNQSTTDLNISGAVYGGSAFGVVNATQKNTNRTSYDTTVTVNAGTIGSVFGGGKGSETQRPYVGGDVTVNINGGKMTNVFGGNDASSQPNGAVNVYLNGGEITNAFGGGNNTLVTTTHVYQIGSKVTNLFGGSNAAGNVQTSNIVVSGGETTNLYGGNNVGGTTATSNITINNGTIGSAYGGGYSASTTTSNVTVNNATITNVFGGGNKAGVQTTHVHLNGGTITNTYGGSNESGNVNESNIVTNESSTDLVVQNIYGGNNQGGTTTTTNIDLEAGTITTVYGGGNQAGTTTTNVELKGAQTTNIYGGGNQAGATTTNIKLTTGSSNYVFGGSNTSGNVTTSNITATNPTNLTVTNLFGGNNQGGVTGTANVDLTGGNYTNIYGGGNLTPTDDTYVEVDGITMAGEFFGGGNQAGINNNTNVIFKNSSISGDLFGGGNLGVVSGNTDVYISNSHIESSAYAGGNGASAIVEGNTLINVDNNSIIDKHVFGGGNAANTGLTTLDNSVSKVNIAGATIGGNVYGGANTAKLFGTVELNIGTDVTPNDLIKSDILIKGTVFGGGEANASGSEDYDWKFVSVTVGIDIKIDGNGHDNFDINGSIFGSGNASTTSGYSNVDISNYGTFTNYKSNISIQRAQTVTIKNSAIKLYGAQDNTNEFNKFYFSLSRIDELKLANDSTLFLENGANLLQKFSSLKIDENGETEATVTINEDGQVTRNVNNRIYMLSKEGNILNIATNEAATTYGEVEGMTFFGLFQLDRNGKIITAMYDDKYVDSGTVPSGDLYAFTVGSYIMGKHKESHDIEKDGFYSNFADKDDSSKMNVEYIVPTPPAGSSYMWAIGEQVESYSIVLSASKYATLGMKEVPIIFTTDPNTRFEVLGFNFLNADPSLELVNSNEIKKFNTEGTANTKMALTMETTQSGFTNDGLTNFFTDEQHAYSGTTTYKKENTEVNPTFLFYLYHSKNITETKEFGTVVVSLQAIIPIDELTNETKRININVNIISELHSKNEYEATMAPGEKHELFSSSATNITSKSKLSAYYSLYMDTETNYYKQGYKHALASSYVLPLDTKITMIDLASEGTPKYYYHVIDSADVTRATNELASQGECSYYLTDFIEMGSTSQSNKYDEVENQNKYYNDDLNITEEEFIFIIDFGDTNINTNVLEKSLLMELRNENDQTLISVLGQQHINMIYNLYSTSNASIETEGELSRENIYVGESSNLNLTTNFIQPMVESTAITDTTYFDKKLGVKLTILDEEDKALNNNDILGINYEYDGMTYYPRMDGTVRIPLADRVANVFSRIKINTENTSLKSGSYKLKIESFGSSDGIYYGSQASDMILVPFTIVNSRYGLKTTLADVSAIIDKETGLNPEGNNGLVFKIVYSSNLENPNIRLSLYRRQYDEVYDKDYTKVNLKDYITNDLQHKGENIYLLEPTPLANMDKFIYMKDNLKSGTYKFVFSLYDGDVYIGETENYIIIK